MAELYAEPQPGQQLVLIGAASQQPQPELLETTGLVEGSELQSQRGTSRIILGEALLPHPQLKA